MREYFTYGSVRGAAGNGGPYRDRHDECDSNCSADAKSPRPRSLKRKVDLDSVFVEELCMAVIDFEN
jgi:hypothetical protein